MNAVLTERRQAVGELCKEFHVHRLDVFGSAAGADFDLAHSDLDFLVEFRPLMPKEHFEAYFGLVEALEELFQRPVDLVELGALQNPYFIQRVHESRTPLYAA